MQGEFDFYSGFTMHMVIVQSTNYLLLLTALIIIRWFWRSLFVRKETTWLFHEHSYELKSTSSIVFLAFSSSKTCHYLREVIIVIGFGLEGLLFLAHRPEVCRGLRINMKFCLLFLRWWQTGCCLFLSFFIFNSPAVFKGKKIIYKGSVFLALRNFC